MIWIVIALVVLLAAVIILAARVVIIEDAVNVHSKSLLRIYDMTKPDKNVEAASEEPPAAASADSKDQKRPQAPTTWAAHKARHRTAAATEQA